MLQHLVISELKKRNIPVQSLRVDNFSKTHVTLSNIALGNNGEVKAARADITLQWTGTSPTVIDTALQHAEVNATLDSNGITLGGVETLWNTAPQQQATGTVRKLALSGDLHVHFAPPGELRLTFKNDLLTLTQHEKPILLPINVSGTLQGDIANQLNADLTFASEKNELQGKANGSYIIATQQGDFHWQTEPVAFAPAAIEFANLSPLYAADFKTFPITLVSSGTVRIRNNDWVATPSLNIVEMPLANVLASALGEGTIVEGLIGGTIPIRITPKGWRIEPANMDNIGGLHIAITPGSASAQALSSHPQAPLVLGALSNFQVANMALKVNSTDNHGGVSLNWHFVGSNPDFMGGKKVDFTLAVNANLEDIVRSTASAQSLVGQAENKK
jgi:hypothetical protein